MVIPQYKIISRHNITCLAFEGHNTAVIVNETLGNNRLVVNKTLGINCLVVNNNRLVVNKTLGNNRQEQQL